MADVFISYTTSDLIRANEIRKILENNGISCWMASRNIQGGERFTTEIAQAISECSVLVPVMTSKAQESEWVFREIQQAIHKRKAVIPYFIENIELTDEFNFLLSANNGINAKTFEGDPIAELLQTIRFYTEEPQGRNKATYSIASPECPMCGSHRAGICLSFRDGLLLRLSSSFVYFGLLLSFVVPVIYLIVLGVMELMHFLGIGDQLIHNLQWLYTPGKEFSMSSFLEELLFVGIIPLAGLGIACGADLVYIKTKDIKRKNAKKYQHYRCYNCNTRFKIAKERK